MLPVALVDGVVLEVVVAAEVRVRPAVVVVDRRLRWLGGPKRLALDGRSPFVLRGRPPLETGRDGTVAHGPLELEKRMKSPRA